MTHKRFSDQIRDAVRGSGMSRYAICKAIDLPESSMSRFMAGKSGLSMDVVDRLAERLGLTVVSRPDPEAIDPGISEISDEKKGKPGQDKPDQNVRNVRP